MIKIFNGTVYDVDTNLPVPGVRIYSDKVVGVVTDEDGDFSLMADDSQLADWFHIDAENKGYGDYVQQLGGLNGDLFIYKTDSGFLSKAKAVIKNTFWGYVITVATIVLIYLISKKYIQ